MSKMNQDVKAKWLEALRSGEYEQGRNYLRSSEDKFCCLGVLCDVAVKEGVIQEPKLEGDAYLYGETVYSGGSLRPWAETSGLPQPVQEWSGVSLLGDVSLQGAYRSLSGLNDTGTSFTEIADIIEKEL